jgi:hypothetical protein
MNQHDSSFMGLLMTRVDKMIEEKQNQIINGSAKSFDHYMALCESVTTLRIVAQAILDTAKEVARQGSAQPSNPAVHPVRDRQAPTYRA